MKCNYNVIFYFTKIVSVDRFLYCGGILIAISLRNINNNDHLENPNNINNISRI